MSEIATQKALGVWRSFGLGQAWPELKTALLDLYKNRVSGLPWIPEGWLASVQALQVANPNDVIRLSPGQGMLRPDFCDTDAKAAAWQDLYKMTDAAVSKYAQAQAVEGRALMNAAYRNAAFWDAAYKIAVTVRDLPGKTVSAVLDGAQEVTKGIFKGLFSSWLFPVMVLGAVGVIAWKFGLIKLKPARK